MLSTMFKEGGMDSPYSSKRVLAFAFFLVGTTSLFYSLPMFEPAKGWVSAFVFIPSAMCYMFTFFYSYLSTMVDIKEILSSVNDITDKKNGTSTTPVFSTVTQKIEGK